MQMEKYFEENKILQEFQFGFRNKKGTTSELLTLFHKLMEAKEEGKEIDGHRIAGNSIASLTFAGGELPV